MMQVNAAAAVEGENRKKEKKGSGARQVFIGDYGYVKREWSV